MTDYQSFMSRLRKCETLPDVKKLEVSLTRFYDAGIFSISELARLDGKVVDRMTELRQDQTKEETK